MSSCSSHLMGWQRVPNMHLADGPGDAPQAQATQVTRIW